MKRALITGVTGQAGSYLVELLLSKGYEVHGLRRRSSTFNTERISHILEDWHEMSVPFHLHYGDMTDSMSLMRVLLDVMPHEIYNLAALSHVGVSFQVPENTIDVVGTGTMRLLEAIRISGLTPRIYQASTSEMFGKVAETPQRETTPFHPRSPYGCAKVMAYHLMVNYREAYGMFCSNGIMFNSESPRRGPTFVTRKITQALARIKFGQQKCLYLGNLEALRDWGHAKDYVEVMWRIVQHHEADDFVIATGLQHSVRTFVEEVSKRMDMPIEWIGSGEDEVGVSRGNVIVRIDRQYKRPAEVDTLRGDSTKARTLLGWTPKVTFSEVVDEMVSSDLALVQRGLV